MVVRIPDATLTSVLGGCDDPEGPVVFLRQLLVLVELRFRRRRPYHRLQTVRPTSAPMIISGVINRRHVQYAVEEGRLLKSNVPNHTGYQSWSILVSMVFYIGISRRSTFRRSSDPRADPYIIVQAHTGFRLSFPRFIFFSLSRPCFMPRNPTLEQNQREFKLFFQIFVEKKRPCQKEY